MGVEKIALLDQLQSQVDQVARAFQWLKETHPGVFQDLEKYLSQEKTEIKAVKAGKRATLGGNGPKVSEVVAHYCDEFKTRYGVHPTITGSAAGGIRRLVKDAGYERARSLITTYLRMNDQWFLKKRHDVETLVGNLNAITVANKTGHVVTAKEAQRVETLDQNARVLSRWLREDEAPYETGKD